MQLCSSLNILWHSHYFYRPHYAFIFKPQYIQIYTGNWLAGCPVGKSGHVYGNNYGVALECQHFPDSPNKPEYPSTVLRPGEVYEEAIIFAFRTV